MMNEKAEDLKSGPGTPNDLWDFISNDTGTDRHICKTIICRLLFDVGLVEGAIEHGLRIDEMTRIRVAFDQYTYEHKE